MRTARPKALPRRPGRTSPKGAASHMATTTTASGQHRRRNDLADAIDWSREAATHNATTGACEHQPACGPGKYAAPEDGPR